MTADVVAKAFDPFFTTKEVGKGTGLGLTQVFGFVKQSGGHVKIYSELGEGTTVKVYLPRFYGDAGGRQTVAPKQSAEINGERETILVVEDDASVLAAHRRPDCATWATRCSKPHQRQRRRCALLERHPDVTLLFTDIVMPDMNGRKLADAGAAAPPA